MNTKFLIILITTMLGIILISACGDADDSADAREEQIEQYAKKHGVDANVKIDDSNGDEEIVINRNVGGNTARPGKNLEVPDDFPRDIPIYPDMNIYAVDKIGAGHMIQAQTSNNPDDIIDFYKEKMVGDGWADEATTNALPSMKNIRFTKGKRMTAVMILTEENQTTVQLSAITTN